LRHLGAKEGDHIRSIALIAGISNYPKLPQDEQSLDAAKIDVDKLEILLKDQKFDEIIVLRDGDVTLEILRYFLRTYALRQADYYKKKLRFLFAYSGHGVEVDRTSSKGLLLAQASSAEDLDNVIGMNELQPYFNDLATSTFHFLALVNSCYGGAIFTVGVQGDDRGNTYSEGAYAITAGPADKKVYSIAAGHGSFFFESLIQGVATGDADNQNKINNLDDSKDSSEPGSTKGTIRLSMLETYLENIIQKQNDKWRELKTSNQETSNQALNDPFVGAVEPNFVSPKGAFFFLQPAYAAPLPPYPAAGYGGRENGPSEWFNGGGGNGGGDAGSGGTAPAPGTTGAGTTGAFWNGGNEFRRELKGAEGLTQLGLNYGAPGQFRWGSSSSASVADALKRAGDSRIQTLTLGPSLTTQSHLNYATSEKQSHFGSDSSVLVAEAFPNAGRSALGGSGVWDYSGSGSNGVSDSGGLNPAGHSAIGGAFVDATHPNAGTDARDWLNPTSPAVPRILTDQNGAYWKALEEAVRKALLQQDQSPTGRYPIHGIDLSDRPDKVDWKKVASGDVKFAFLKATQSASFVDPSFAQNWDQSKKANVQRGAYHTFSFCDSPEAQFVLIAKVVPVDPLALPIAVDAELFEGQEKSNIDYLARQGACALALGPAGIAKNLTELLDNLRGHYAKKPVLYANTEFINKLKDKLTGAASIWIADYSAASRMTFAPPTGDLWQFTDAASVPGVAGLTDLSVFAGTPDEFQKFANGE
jgi:GH25 family lysozyme M1 (1,4-beta-N-acetylmuramidase)